MDKQTLSGYGWIVIVTLVLAVLLALATPFGTYVGDGVVTTVNGLINTSSKAVDEDQIDTMSDKWENKFSTFDKVGGVNDGNEEETLAPGLYKTDGTFVNWEQLKSMEYQIVRHDCSNLCAKGKVEQSILTVENGLLMSANSEGNCCDVYLSSEYLNGELVISNEVQIIDGYTFGFCNGLTKVIIPNNVEIIGSCSFYYCENLKSITIPSTLAKIENSAFSSCNKLIEINYEGTKAQWNNIELYNSNSYSAWNRGCPQITVHCTDGDIIIPANK